MIPTLRVDYNFLPVPSCYRWCIHVAASFCGARICADLGRNGPGGLRIAAAVSQLGFVDFDSFHPTHRVCGGDRFDLKLTLVSSPGWTVNQFVYVAGTQSNTYYAIIGPNIAPVSGTVSLTNGTTAVTATSGLSSMVPNDELLVNGLAYNARSFTLLEE